MIALICPFGLLHLPQHRGSHLSKTERNEKDGNTAHQHGDDAVQRRVIEHRQDHAVPFQKRRHRDNRNTHQKRNQRAFHPKDNPRAQDHNQIERGEWNNTANRENTKGQKNNYKWPEKDG